MIETEQKQETKKRTGLQGLVDLFMNALPRAMVQGKMSRGEANYKRRYGVEPQEAPKDEHSAHPGSVLAGKVRWKLPRLVVHKNGFGSDLSQHERVVALRAKRRGLTVKEYERAYPKG